MCLIEDHIAKIEAKIEKDCVKAAKRFGDAFNREEFVTTNGRILDRQKKIDEINKKMNAALSAGKLEDVKSLIERFGYKMSCFGHK